MSPLAAVTKKICIIPHIHLCNYLRVPSVIANGIFAKTLTKEEIAVFVILRGHDNIVVSKWERLNG